MMLNVHLVPSEVNESVIIMHIKPNLQPNNTNITGDVGLFAFMNKGTVWGVRDAQITYSYVSLYGEKMNKNENGKVKKL